MSDLQSLIERVEKATANERDLFVEVAKALVGPYEGGDLEARVAFWGRLFRLLDAEAYESAALSLVERKLPEWGWSTGTLVREEQTVGYAAFVCSRRDDSCEEVEGATPALAICLALLKAVQAQANNDATEETRG